MNRSVIPVLVGAALAVLGFDAPSGGRDAPSPAMEERIVFHSDAAGNAEIYSMRPDGSDVRRLTHHPAQDSCPVISPDGRKIAFLSDRDGNDEIYVCDPDGSDPVRLTCTPYSEGPPRWSPDGLKIISWVVGPADAAEGNIFVISAGGTGLRWLTGIETAGSSPDISPDGRRIVFSARREGRFQLWLMDAQGSGLRPLTVSAGDKLLARWSPRGDRLTYTEVIDFRNSRTRVHVMNADGGGDRVVADKGVVNEDSSWSPDGRKLVFQTSRDGNYEIYAADADGRNPVRLTRTPAMENFPNWGRVLLPAN